MNELIKFKPNFIFINGAIHHLDDKIVKLINSFIQINFSNCYFLSVDPIKNNNSLLNSLMIKLDRGKFIRDKSHYAELMKSFESFILNLPFDGFSIVCFDNKYLKKIIKKIKTRNLITYSIKDEKADMAKNNKIDEF